VVVARLSPIAKGQRNAAISSTSSPRVIVDRGHVAEVSVG